MALASENPVYIRLPGNLNCPIVYKEDAPFKLGGSNVLRIGKDVSIFACGTMVSTALVVSKQLAEQGVDASVVDIYSIKPLDKEVINAAQVSKLIVTIEEHSKIGGLGAAVAEVMCEYTGFPRLMRLGIADCFDLACDYDGLLSQNRLTAPQITEEILSAL